MMIDSSYFTKGMAYIPNIKAKPLADEGLGAQINHMSNNKSIEDFIKIYEGEYMNYLFGKDFAAYVIEHIDDVELQDLKALLLDPATKQSPIAFYVFCFWWVDSQSFLTNTGGEQYGDYDYGDRSESSGRYIFVWNKMSEKTKLIIDYVNDNAELFEEHVNEEDMIYHERLTKLSNTYGF